MEAQAVEPRQRAARVDRFRGAGRAYGGGQSRVVVPVNLRLPPAWGGACECCTLGVHVAGVRADPFNIRGDPTRKIIAALALVAAAGSAVALDENNAMATVNQFVDGFNKGDVKSALATCASPTSIVDEFPPCAWQGPTACADWAGDFDANSKKNEITDEVVKLAKPKHVEVTADRAYVVVPANYTYRQKGKKVAQNGSTMALALK
jgi:hypothetical protein